ncbi:MAG: prolipoprotein diacylglyceryl transferase [Pirellulaceae bacterium]|nr:prolipoprotein diacylglyceryl transferase [Pirellulaceae bacterium]
MRQVLFYIPAELAGLPVFGMGWLLILWLAGWTIYTVVLACLRRDWQRELLGHLLLIGLGAGVCFLLNWMLETTPAGEPLGLPIRGYGVMLLLATVAGVGLSVYAASREGIEPDVILSLAFWMFLAGIAGARLFFVIQYWKTFQRETPLAALLEMLKFTEGGLVVYGSVIGGLLAAVVYLRRQKLPVLKVGDLIAPGMLLGLALGRLGCLLNGCCWGGACENPYLALHFPPASPPYLDQLDQGQLLGLSLVAQAGEEDEAGEPQDAEDRQSRSARGPWLVAAVEPGSPAARRGLQPGQLVLRLSIRPADEWREAIRTNNTTVPLVSLEADDTPRVEWNWSELPGSSGGVHPTQLYSSLNAALLAWFLWCYYPFRRRDGEVFALMLSLYPIARILLEWIRVDEPGQWGTSLTISQWVSLGLLALAAALWLILFRRPVLSESLGSGGGRPVNST